MSMDGTCHRSDLKEYKCCTLELGRSNTNSQKKTLDFGPATEIDLAATAAID